MRAGLVVMVLAFLPVSAMASLADADAALAAYDAKAAALQAQLGAGNQEGVQALEEETKALAAEAQARYRDAGAADADDPGVLTAYARALRATDDYDLAAELLERAVRRTPEDAALWRQYGGDLGAVGPAKRREAFEVLGRALTLDSASPAAAETYFVRGKLYHEEGLFELAHTDYDAALALDANHVAAQIGKAVLDARNGEVVAAAAVIDALGVAAQPYDAWTRVKLREALHQFEGLRKFFDDNAANHAAYARLLYRAARVPDALLAARHAVTLDPNGFDTWNLIGSMQLQIGTPQNAREAFVKSLAANPDQPGIRGMIEQLPAE